jgi:hypothetical protein
MHEISLSGLPEGATRYGVSVCLLSVLIESHRFAIGDIDAASTCSANSTSTVMFTAASADAHRRLP